MQKIFELLDEYPVEFVELPDNFMESASYSEAKGIGRFEMPLWEKDGTTDMEIHVEVYNDGRDDKYQIANLYVP